MSLLPSSLKEVPTVEETLYEAAQFNYTTTVLSLLRSSPGINVN